MLRQELDLVGANPANVTHRGGHFARGIFDRPHGKDLCLDTNRGWAGGWAEKWTDRQAAA